MNRKKAQMEIIGLVVIVILISLGLLFLVQFALKEKPDSQAFTRKGLAFSTTSTLMKTTADCGGGKELSMRELLAECAENRLGTRYPFTRTCGEAESCEKFQVISEALLQGTLGSWGKRYELNATLREEPLFEPPIIAMAGGCAGRDRDTSGSFAHPTDVGTIKSILYVCE